MAARRGNGMVASPPPTRAPRRTVRRLRIILAIGSSSGESGRQGDGAEALSRGDLGEERDQAVAAGLEGLLPGGQLGLVGGGLLVAGGVAEDVAEHAVLGLRRLAQGRRELAGVGEGDAVQVPRAVDGLAVVLVPVGADPVEALEGIAQRID